MGSITMKQLARKLGVSVTTISNAYNRPDRLSADLRARILATGEELGYCGPDAAGRLLRSGKANAIGVISGSSYSYAFTDPYAIELFAGMSGVLEREGVSLALIPTAGDRQGAEAISNAVVDAIINMSARSKSRAIDVARRRGLRVIFTHMVDGAEYVAIDDHLAGQMMGRHLTSLGHRRVAIVYQDHALDEPMVYDVGRLTAICADFAESAGSFWGVRLQGIVDGLGPDCEVVLIAIPDNERLAGRLAAIAAVHLDPRPTAVVALSDRMALGVLDEIEDRRLVAGRDISVAGFDAVPESRHRGLTSVRQPTAEKGRLLARLALEPDAVEHQIVLPVDLVVGRTTAAPGPALVP